MATEKSNLKPAKKVVNKKPKVVKDSGKKPPIKKTFPAKRARKNIPNKKAKATVKRLRSLEIESETATNENDISEAASNTNLTRELPQTPLSLDCKCMQRKTKFYCYRLIQGAWQQVSGIGYPTKESCEEDNCMQL